MAKAKRGKKRKLSEFKENGPVEEIPKIDRSKIVLEEKGWMPSVAVQFYEKYGIIDEKLQEIDPAASFLGPFRKLKGEIDVSGTELIMLDREAIDLPEMQPFMVCSAGRYAFWRDVSTTTDIYVVFMDRRTLPEVTLVGNTVEHAILHFLDTFAKFTDSSLSSRNKKGDLLGMSSDEVNALMKEKSKIVVTRKNLCVGGPMGPGLILIDSGSVKRKYRVITNKTYNIEHLLRSLRLVGIKEHEKRVELVIETMVNDVSVCNDEGDYANGLELGHLLFLANKKSIEEHLMRVLVLAYKLILSPDFVEILFLTVELRR